MRSTASAGLDAGRVPPLGHWVLRRRVLQRAGLASPQALITPKSKITPRVPRLSYTLGPDVATHTVCRLRLPPKVVASRGADDLPVRTTSFRKDRRDALRPFPLLDAVFAVWLVLRSWRAMGRADYRAARSRGPDRTPTMTGSKDRGK